MEAGKNKDNEKVPLETVEILRKSLENSTDAIGMSTPDGHHYYQNKKFDELFGELTDPVNELYYDSRVGRQVFQTLISGGVWTGEVKMNGRDGKVLDIFLRAYANKDSDGKIVSLVGIHNDITEKKKAEEALIASEERASKQRTALAALVVDDLVINGNLPLVFKKITEELTKTLDAERAGVWMFNDDQTELQCVSLYDAGKKEHSRGDSVKTKDIKGYLESIKKESRVIADNSTQDPRTVNTVEYYQKPLGITSMLDAGIVVEGQLKGVISCEATGEYRKWHVDEEAFISTLASLLGQVFVNAERKKAEDEILYLSYHDRLTGLYNRRYIEKQMEIIETAETMPTSIIMADLNGLKLVNDTYGHEAGDKLLINAANALKRSCRENDQVARWGGDEFIILMPSGSLKDAEKVVRHILSEISRLNIGAIPISIAIGVAGRSEENTKMIDVLREAENRMYRQKLTESRSTKNAVLQALLKTLAEKSYETEIHTRRMQEIGQKIGIKLNLPETELNRLGLLITLHDIGKINISEEILTKKGPLTVNEWEAIKKHPEIGFRIARATEEFAHVAEDILAHHEKWDGSGYPRGLKRSDIPLLARITAIADAYEVMSYGRPYKKAMSKKEIIEEYQRCSGRHFDPELVEIFLSIISQVN